jgi:hypothetical protein
MSFPIFKIVTVLFGGKINNIFLRMMGVESYIFSVLKNSSNCSFHVTFKLASLCPWYDGSLQNMQNISLRTNERQSVTDVFLMHKRLAATLGCSCYFII